MFIAILKLCLFLFLLPFCNGQKDDTKLAFDMINQARQMKGIKALA
jgi:hypothetical protein